MIVEPQNHNVLGGAGTKNKISFCMMSEQKDFLTIK